MPSSISQIADLTADGAEDADAKPEQPMNAPASVRDADHCWRIRAGTTNFRLPIFNSQFSISLEEHAATLVRQKGSDAETKN